MPDYKINTPSIGSDVSVTMPAQSGTIALSDSAIKVSANDTTGGVLNGKLVAGSNVSFTENNDGANETLTIAAADTNDAAKVSANDTTAGYLNGKLVAGTGIAFTENNDGTNETLTIASTVTAGVTGFTGSQNTASPNNTVNASRLLVNATSVNADAVLQPKGSGSLLTQLPDNTVTGGSKRGIRAVDLQLSRGNSSQVAQGENSTIGGGASNQAQGIASTVTGGSSNLASGQYATSIGGRTNTASGNDAIAGGNAAQATATGAVSIGTSTQATATHAVAIGRSCVAQAIGSVAIGYNIEIGASAQSSIGFGGTTSASGKLQITGAGSYAFGSHSQVSGAYCLAVGSGAIADKIGQHTRTNLPYWDDGLSGGNPGIQVGSWQTENYLLKARTDGNTITTLTSDNNLRNTNNMIAIKNDSTYTFLAYIVARRTDVVGESAAYKIEGVVDNNGGTTAFVAVPTVTVLAEDTAAWDATVDVDDTNDELRFQVTGEAGKTIRWAASVQLLKISGPPA